MTGKHSTFGTITKAIARRKPRRLGLFGVGHHTYWGQFEGLFDELTGYMEVLERNIEAREVEVVNFGIVDDARTATASCPG